MRVRAFISAILVLAAVLPVEPAAAERTLIMSLRQPPNTLSEVILREANNLVWQKLSRLPGVQAVPEAQIAQQMGGSYGAFQACVRDDCMQQLGYLAGVKKLCWGYVQRTPGNGYHLHLRSLRVGVPQVLGTLDAECRNCMEAELLGRLMSLDPTPLRLVDGMAAPPAPPVAPPTSPVAPPPTYGGPGVAPPPAQPPSGFLTIVSKPAGADVMVGDRKVATTPMKDIQLPAGTHNFVLRLEGYVPATITPSVLVGQHNQVEVVLHPSHQKLTIRSTPAGATVSFNGQPVGQTPLIDVSVALGIYEVAVALAGYQTAQQQLTLEGGRPKELKLTLRKEAPTNGILEINSRPPAALLTVNGQPAGPAPYRGELPGGQVELIASLDGHVGLRQMVEVTPGKTNRITMTLKKEPPSTGNARVTSQPKGAQVFLDNQPMGPAPVNISASKGNHLLRWELAGFSTVEKTVEIVGGGRHVFDVKLSKAPPPPGTGSVQIEVEPKNAVVTLGGRAFPAGNVPEQVLMVGTYPVIIKADGHQPLEFQIEVEDQKNQKIHKGLAKLPPPPAPGLLSVSSTPPGANVQANGVDIGKTPVRNFKLEPGFYTIGIYLEGYANVEQEIEIVSRKKKTVDEKLKSLFAILKVQSSPKGATVFLNDQELGTTPGTFTKLKGGTHKILVSMEGFQEKLGEVNLKEGEVVEVSYSFDEAPGFLNIKVQPRAARILVDGKDLGTSPLRRHPLMPGPHEVVVKLEGYEDAQGKVTIEKGREKSLNFELVEIPKPPTPPVAPTEPVDGGTTEPGATTPEVAPEPASPPATPASPPATPAASEGAATPSPATPAGPAASPATPEGAVHPPAGEAPTGSTSAQTTPPAEPPATPAAEVK